MIDIKSLSGDIRFSTPVNKGCKRKFLLMKEDYITVKFSSDSPVHFKLGDYIEDPRFGIFELCSLQKPDYNRKRKSYDYELRFDAYYWKWNNKIFKYTPEIAGNEASWSLASTLDVQMGVFLRNLEALGYTYKGKPFEFSIGPTVENKVVAMTYDNSYLLDSLFQMANKWDCECWVTENIIHFGRCENGSPVDFERGKNVEEMTSSESQSDYYTRIIAFGSTRNLPVNYRPVDESVVVNGIVQKRLMLPAGIPYIDAYENMSMEEAIEQVVIFDYIYPRRTGTMTDVTTKEYTDTIENADGTTTEKKWNAYRFKDTGVNFSSEYKLETEDLKIAFQSGLLNGLIFVVKFNPDDLPEKLEDGSWNPEAQVWEIVRNTDYGPALPDELQYPQNNDTYVLSGWDSTKIEELGLVAAAEKELETETRKHAEKVKIDPSTYTCKMMSDWVYSEDGVHKLLGAGARVRLVNSAFFESGSRQSRVIGFEYDLALPYDSPVYTVGETAAYSRIGELEEKIESLTLKGQTYSGNGGTGVYVITSNDSTAPSDWNVFSALRAMAEFLSKTRPDIAREIITFLKGAKFGSDGKGKPIFIIDNEIKTSNFTEGDLGAGLVIKTLENGNSYIEVDELFVRKLAYFVELVIKRLTHVGGEIILSPASMTCSLVEEFEDFYRCYFNQDDGDRSIVQEFKAGDQARSQTFNVKEGTSHNVSNQYYWRLVVGTGENYIDLSKTDCDRGSTVPVAGDYIVQLGNRTDTSRQNAQVLSSYGSDAPSYKQYKGINSYSLEGKEMAKISPSGNKIIGDFILTTGVDIATQFNVLEGLISSEVASVRKEIAERDNLFSNAAFSENTLGWQTAQAYTPYTVDGKYLFLFGKPYAWKREMVGIATVDGKNSLRIKESSIRQLNGNFASHPAFELIKKLITDAAGNPVLDILGNPTYKSVKEARMFTIEFYYRCAQAGTLSVSFEGVDKTGFESFEAVSESVELSPNTSFVKHTLTGMWNGTGDFLLSFTGDIYIQSLMLTEDKFADIEYRYSTKFEQTDKLISLNASEIKKVDIYYYQKYAELKVMADGITATVAANYKELNEGIETLSSKYTELSVTADGLSARISSSYTTLDSKIDSKYSDSLWWSNYYLEATAKSLRSEFNSGINDVETAYSRLEQTVKGLSTTVSTNKSDADKAIATMNTTLGSINSGLTTAQKDIVDAKGTLTTVQNNLSSVINRLGTVESNYVTTTTFNQTKDLVAIQASKWDSLGTLVSQAGFVLSSDASSWYVAKGEVISAINMTSGSVKIHSDRIDMEGVTRFTTGTARNSSVWVEGDSVKLYSSNGTSRYMLLDVSYSSPELSMYDGSNVARIVPYQLYIVRGSYGTTFGAYSNGKIDIRADSWPTSSSQVSINGVYVDGTTLKVRAN